MAFVNNYEMIDIARALDMRSGEYKDAYRMFIGPGIGGDEPDYGHCLRRVFDTDNLSMLRIPSAPGLRSPAKPGYVYHPGQAEIEYCLYGERRISYPDGKKYYLHPYSVFMHAPDQPHGMEGLSVGKSGVICFHSAKVSQVGRALWPAGKFYEAENGYTVAHTPEMAVWEGSPEGIEIKHVAETYKMAFCDVVIKPGASTSPKFFKKDNCDSIVFVVSGTGLFVYPDKAYCIEEEMAAYNHAGQPYRYMNTGKEDLHLAVCHHAEHFEDVVSTEVRASDLA
ncbi:MAG: cupin domain-containing protein [Oscillospiraceae bacterium]